MLTMKVDNGLNGLRVCGTYLVDQSKISLLFLLSTFRRTRLNAERRLEERARHAEAEAQEKKKEEAAKEAKRKAAAMGGQKTSSMMSLAKKAIPARYVLVSGYDKRYH